VSGHEIGENEELRICLRLLRYDVKKRFDVLHAELAHLISLIEYRTGGPKDSGSKHDQQSFLDRLEKSATEMITECKIDQVEIGDYEEETEWLRAPKAYGTGNPHSVRTSRFGVVHFDILWHAKMATKATVLAERLGDLHDRLDQFLQRTNPDHPDPTLRRRTEDGLGDKFLMESCRWAHRDLASFVTAMGAQYPYTEVPSTYQFWTYHHTSCHHSFASSAAHRDWAKRLEESSKRMSKHCNPTALERIKPTKFSVVALSYWMPERIALQPIIGHELAHQVVRDLYGRELNVSALERDRSDFARMYRNITSCIESWLAARDAFDATTPKNAASLSVEIVCDLLALARYGTAYLYAWTLEILVDEAFSGLFHDEHGMLQNFRLQEQKGNKEAVWNARFSCLETMAIRLVGALPTTYLRGFVLHRAATQLAREHADPVARAQLKAFKNILDVLADIYSGSDEANLEYNKALADDLADIVVFRDRNEAGGETRRDKSAFVTEVNKLWFCPTEFQLTSPLLARQVVSSEVRRLFQAITGGSGEGAGGVQVMPLAWPAVATLTDLAWRIEWWIESLAEANKPIREEHRNQIRALLLFGMDDYLYRTGSPRHLVRLLLEGQDEWRQAGYDFLPAHASNSFDSSTVADSHNGRCLGQLDDVLATVGRNKAGHPIESVRISLRVRNDRESKDVEVAIPPTNIRWLDKIHFKDGALAGWLFLENGAPVAYTLNLLRVRSSQSLLDDQESARVALSNRFIAAPGGSIALVDSRPLLGRYDAFILTKGVARMSDNSTEQQSLNMVSRFKKLVRVGQRESEEVRETLVIVLISLKWEVLRSVVGRWLTERELQSADKYSNCCVNTYLSDGWEDIVVFCGKREGVGLDAFIGEILGLIRALNDNPMIASTETLFTPDVLESRQLHFRFMLNFSDHGDPQSLDYEARTTAAQFSMDISNVAGRKDIEIQPASELALPRLREFHRYLHGKYSDGNRVETLVTWKLAVADTPSSPDGSEPILSE
jgi:hypothetical protein